MHSICMTICSISLCIIIKFMSVHCMGESMCILFLTIEFFSYIVKTDFVDIHAFLASGTSLHHFIEVKIAVSSSATTENMNKLNKNCISLHTSLFIVLAKFELKVHIFYFAYNIFLIYLHQTFFFSSILLKYYSFTYSFIVLITLLFLPLLFPVSLPHRSPSVVSPLVGQ